MHNIGAVQEKLDNLDEAIAHFKRAYEFVKEHLGTEDPFYKKSHFSCSLAKQKL